MTDVSRTTLSDGRILAWDEYGDPDGTPVIYFHGFPSSRLEAEFTDAAATALGVRVIAPDRPGYGGSDFKPGRMLADWPDDVAELAGVLSLDRFAVMGVSGGGPYAMACAWKLGERLTAAALVCALGPVAPDGVLSGMTPILRHGLGLSQRSPGLADAIFSKGALAIGRHPERFVATIARLAPSADRAALRDPVLRRAVAACYGEAFRQGTAGPAHDLALYSAAWGFQLEGITAPVHLWQGEEDTTVPPAMGRYLAQRIPNCRARFFPGEAHFSLVLNRAGEILATLAGS